MLYGRATWIFLALTFAVSWSVAEIGFRLLPANPQALALVGVAFMYGPALAALITWRWVLRRPVRTMGRVWVWNRWLVVAVALPLLITIAWVGLAPTFPDVELALDTAAAQQSVLTKVPEAQREAAMAALQNLGDALVPLVLFQLFGGAILAGITINAAAAFGEELGWRGFLHQTLGNWGLWRRACFIGFFWGLWHLPLVARGLGFIDSPVFGLAAMMAYCLLLSPLFELLRERSGGLLAPVWAHGTFNALGSSTFLLKGPELLIGPAGAISLLVLLILNILLWAWLRKQPKAPHGQAALAVG